MVDPTFAFRSNFCCTETMLSHNVFSLAVAWAALARGTHLLPHLRMLTLLMMVAPITSEAMRDSETRAMYAREREKFWCFSATFSAEIASILGRFMSLSDPRPRRRPRKK